MSRYTTGEIAKLCHVSVRTVQYYDTRNILVPSELSEGGRRLYSEDDLKRMQVICFLRGLGLSIDSIGKLLAEEDPGSVITLLLDQQEAVLKDEIVEREEQLERLSELKSALRSMSDFSVGSIGDIAYTMENKKEMKKIQRTILFSALPLGILEIVSIVLWITKGIWWLFPVWLVLSIPYGIVISRWYYRKVAYICPQCHRVFKPTFREMLFAAHTPATRRLTCTECGHHGFCVETAAKPEVKTGA